MNKNTARRDTAASKQVKPEGTGGQIRIPCLKFYNYFNYFNLERIALALFKIIGIKKFFNG